MTHVGYNARSLLRDRELDLSESDSAFVVAKVYLKPSLLNAIRAALPGRTFDGYTRI